jgi:probable rRNA maturation factor
MTSPLAAESGPLRMLLLRNTQRDCPVNLRALRQVLRHLLEVELALEGYELALHFLTAPAMARANLAHLEHGGPTDVITFDYAERRSALHGELLICPAVARVQAREYGTTWMSELTRYAVHGILHLQGYDDQTAAARRRMKREEDRLISALERVHDLANLRRTGPAAPAPTHARRYPHGKRCCPMCGVNGR